jgi:hypothetical protein
MRWRWLSAALLGAVVLGLGGAGLVAAVPEWRDAALLRLAPGHFRNAQLQRLVGPRGDEVYLLGTIHALHLTTPHYQLAHLAALIAHLRPDLVMVEARPAELARGNLGDGPIEALYAQLTAREDGLRAVGVDWWTMNPQHQVDSDEREQRIFDNLRAGLPGRGRTLTLIGYSHLGALRQRLVGIGYRPAPLSGAQKEALFEPAGQPTSFPPRMSLYTLRRIKADRATLTNVTDTFWRDRLTSAITAREQLLRVVYAAGERGSGPRIAAAPAPR